jgi:MFS family permease
MCLCRLRHCTLSRLQVSRPSVAWLLLRLTAAIIDLACLLLLLLVVVVVLLVVVVDYSSEQAGFIVAGMNGIVLVAPLAAWLIGKIGKRCEIWLVSVVALAAAFFALSLCSMNPIAWMLMVGFFFSLQAASVTAAVALLVPHADVALAYSIESFMFTIALCVLPYVFGELRNWSGSYRVPLLFFSALNVATIAAIGAIYVMDVRKGWILWRKDGDENEY